MAHYLTATDSLSPWARLTRSAQYRARLGRALLLALGWMVLSGPVTALTMGELVVHSSPGKPLRASISLVLQDQELLSELRVTLASDKFYAGEQLERPAFLEGMRIGLLATGERSARIQLFGEAPWQGEEAFLLLHAVSPQKQHSLRFRLAGVHREDGVPEQAYRFVEVTENDTLDAIAMRLSVGTHRSYLHMMYALFLANPEAFYRNNMNNLKRGARLQVPDSAQLYRLKDAEVFQAIRQQYALWRLQQETPTKATTEAGALLSEMSDAQASALDFQGKPQVLQQQMQQLSEENESIQRRNTELKARLARLEQQMEQVAEQVLDYQPGAQPLPLNDEAVAAPEPVDHDSVTTPDPEAKDSATASAIVKEKRKPAGAEGLPGYIMFFVILLALGGGVLVWRYNAGRQEGDT